MSGSPGAPPLASKLIFAVARIMAIALATIVAVSLITHVWWRFTPTRNLDILVYDQTVSDERFTDHAILDHVFEYHRINFDIANDYVGAAPGGEGLQGSWPTEPPDLAFLADTYGVYLNETGEVDELGDRRVTGTLKPDQANDIAAWIDDGVPVYGEFPLVRSPTPPETAEILERSFGFVASDWSVQWVDELADVSPQIKAQVPGRWAFTGPGLVAVTTPVQSLPVRQKVLVLPRELVTGKPLVIGGPPGSIPGTAEFNRWLGVVEADADVAVDAWFELQVTDTGRALLKAEGIPTRMPALIRNGSAMYFSGDGLDDDTPFRLRRNRGGARFMRLVTGDEFQFLYQILEPSVSWMLRQHDANA